VDVSTGELDFEQKKLLLEMVDGPWAVADYGSS